MHAMLHREYHTAHYARAGGTNNEQRASLLSLLVLKLVEFAKVARCVTNAFLGFAKLNAILITVLKMDEAHENLGSRWLEFLSNYKMMACLVEFLLVMVIGLIGVQFSL